MTVTCGRSRTLNGQPPEHFLRLADESRHEFPGRGAVADQTSALPGVHRKVLSALTPGRRLGDVCCRNELDDGREDRGSDLDVWIRRRFAPATAARATVRRRFS